MTHATTIETQAPQLKPRLMRRLLAAGLISALLISTGWGATNYYRHGSVLGAAGSSDSVDPRLGRNFDATSWYRVTPIDFNLSIIASGELDSKKKEELKCMVEGQATIIEVIEEGRAVKEGDVLVRLATDAIMEKIEQETLNLERAQQDRIASEQQLVVSQNEAETAIRSGELKIRMAELELERWRRGTDIQEQRKLKLELEKARRNLVTAERDVKLSQQLWEEKFVSLTELEKHQIAEIEAINALATAELQIKVYENYVRPKDEQKFITDVEQAKSELERVRRRYDSELRRFRNDLESKVRTQQFREDRLAKLQEQLESSVITAPQNGLVVYASSIGRNRMNNPIEQGRAVRFNETIIILPDTSQMIATLRVNEALISQIKPGNQVVVTIDARSREPILGKVYQIGVMAEDGGWMNPDLREYTVRVDLPTEAQQGTLRPAMRCTGEIIVGEVKNALAVPVQSVLTEGRTQFVYVPGPSGKVRKRNVKIGRASETYVEILSGLEADELVLIRRPRPGEIDE